VAHASAVIDQRPAHDSKPAVTYRHAGDRYLMVEYGEMVLDMTLNFFVQAVDRLVREAGIEGLIETSPGFRSMLVGHDAAVLSRGDLIARLDDIHDAVPDQSQLTIPSRLITLPITFDDSQSRDAVERYLRVTRADAPKVPGELAKAGVPFAFSSAGLDDPKDFVRNAAKRAAMRLPDGRASLSLSVD